MNKKQIVVLWFGIAIIVLMGLFPPNLKTEPENDINASSYHQVIRYEFLFTASTKRVQYLRLLTQWFIVSIVAAGLMVTLSVRPSRADFEAHSARYFRSRSL